MANNSKGRSSVWGNAQISRPRIPLEIAMEIDRIRSQVQDPSKAKNYILDLLRLEDSTIELKLYDGRVSAGPENIAFGDNVGDESSFELRQVPTSLIRRRKSDSFFLLRVSGNSMEDVGIFDDNIVSVERFEGIPSDGKIVVACVQDQILVKQYRFRRKQHELRSRNKEEGYPTIFITPDMSEHFYVKILGLVHDVIPEDALTR